MIKDSTHDLLSQIRESEGFVYASPIYYFEVSGVFHSFLERLLYPGRTAGRDIPVFGMYAMNSVSEHYEKMTAPVLANMEMMIQNCFHGPMNSLHAFDTFQRELSDRYQSSKSDHAAKKARHEKVLPDLLNQAYEAGKNMAAQIQAIEKRKRGFSRPDN